MVIWMLFLKLITVFFYFLEIVKKSIAERFKQRLYNMLFSGITVEKFYPWKKKVSYNWCEVLTNF